LKQPNPLSRGTTIYYYGNLQVHVRRNEGRTAPPTLELVDGGIIYTIQGFKLPDMRGVLAGITVISKITDSLISLRSQLSYLQQQFFSRIFHTLEKLSNLEFNMDKNGFIKEAVRIADIKHS